LTKLFAATLDEHGSDTVGGDGFVLMVS